MHPPRLPLGETELLDLDEVGGRVERTELPGGLRVLTETMPGVLSATLGIWVGVGSRDETPALGRLVALPRAPAVQGDDDPQRAGDRDGDGRRRR